MIKRPKGEALLFRRNTWNVVYYEDGMRKQKSLSTPDYNIATFRRDLFFQDAQAQPRKEYAGKDKYVYKQLPFFVKIGKKLVGRFRTRSEATEARDKFLESN